MKNLITTLICSLLLLGYSQQAAAQAADCFTAGLSPFCGGIAQYAANSDGTGSGAGPQAPTGPNYDCLGTQGNPTYFSVTIDQAGSIDFTLDNTAGNDIDFILWGPFNGLSAASNACDSMGTGGVWGDVADCSYSISGQEQVTVANTQVGEVYILMVSNYENTPTNIFSTSNIGTGSIACACDIPVVVDTLSAAFGNQGFLADTTGGLQQFVVCANNTVGFRVSAGGSLNDTLSLYGPFTSIPAVTPNFSTFEAFPRVPSFDTIDIFVLMTPDETNIGVNDFTVGVSNKINTGTALDSSCFDQIQMQLVVPGVRLNDRMVCSGEQFQILTDSVPTTALGSSSYTWSQISGTPVTFSSTTAPQPFVTIPTTASTSSNDSIVIVVDYNYGSLCPISDTMVLRFPDNNITFTASMDSVCAGQTTTLSAVLADTFGVPVCNDYTISTIPLAPVAGSGTRLNLGDDQLSAALPLGFDFDFYCNTYNTFAISSNGFITFDLAAGSGCCSGELLPDAGFFGSVNDVIAMCWTDCSPNNGGVIEYFTVGTAPNRRLIVNFTNVPPFSTGSGNQTVQAILYEATNVIEIHATNVTPSGTTFANEVTLGIENSDGTIAHAPASTNATTTAFSNVAYRFSPVLVGPFYTFTPSTGTPNTVSNPTVTINATTTYSVVVTDDVCAYQDTILITALSTYPTPVVMCDSSDLTSISVSWSDVGLPAGGFYEYSLDNGTTWVNVGAALNTTLTGLNNNTTYNISIRGNDNTGGICTLSPIGVTNCTTLNPDCTGNAPISIMLNATDILCNGDSTACINATVGGGTGNPFSNLAWSTGAMNVDSICGVPAGTYSLVVTDTFSATGGSTGGINMIYQEAFDGGANGWTLNVPTGTNGTDNNFWTVGNDEAGNPVGTCGSAGGTNQSLYIESAFAFSTGAAYDAGGLCPILACPETNMRAESPTFSTIGQSNMTLDFNYIAGGDALIDNASVFYNAGAGWVLLTNTIKSATCAGGQGLWTKYSVVLPAACDNQPNVQVGINWTNNDDGVGTDPSVAIDSVTVFSTTPPSTLISCVDSMSITILEPTAVDVVVDSTTNPTCSGSADGSISITATGGTAAYTYLWPNATTVEDITGLNNGTYTVTVSDANNCTDTVSATLTVPNPILISVDNITNNSCAGTTDGSITISATGGVGALSYLWANGTTTVTNTAIAEGTYIVSVTDANNCMDTAQATVIPTVFLTTTDTTTNPNCFGQSGNSTVTVAGGSGSYTFDWGTSSTSTTGTATLAGGTHIVTITDSGNGCMTMDTVTITVPDSITITTINVNNIACTGTINSGSIDVNISGGTAPYSFNWSTGAATEDLVSLTAGSYTLTVTDGNNCTQQASYTVTGITAVDVTINTLVGMVGCDLTATGSAVAVATGGSGFTYNWSTGTANDTIINLAAGTYTVTATNSDGCTDTAIVTITAPVIPTLAVSVGLATGQQADTIQPSENTTVFATGGAGQSYNWTATGAGNPAIATPNAASSIVTPDAEGNYTYTVVTDITTNGTNCTATDSVTVTVEPAYLGIPDAFTPNGDGLNDLFRPVTLQAKEVIQFRIYNRLGQLVYTGDDLENDGWDGTLNGVAQARDIYMYVLEYKRATDNNVKSVRGQVTLLR